MCCAWIRARAVRERAVVLLCNALFSIINIVIIRLSMFNMHRPSSNLLELQFGLRGKRGGGVLNQLCETSNFFPLPPLARSLFLWYNWYYSLLHKTGIFSHSYSICNSAGRKRACVLFIIRRFFSCQQFTTKLNIYKTCVYGFLGCVCQYNSVYNVHSTQRASDGEMRSHENYFKAMIHNFCHFDSIRKR